MFINKKICFIENSNGNINFTEIDNSSPSDKIFVRKSNRHPMNILHNNNLYITLKIGAFSSFDENNLVANKFYKKDDNITNKGIYSPFNDSSNKGNTISCSNNPNLFSVNIGSNPSEDFDDLFSFPFEDIGISLYDRRIPYYRQYVNAYNIHTLEQSVSILGSLEEISGKYVMETILQGAKGYIPRRDARNRTVNITDTFDINDNAEEGFLDLEINPDENPTGLTQRNYSYETRVVNGVEQTYLNVEESSTSYIETLTRTVLFYNEENMLIKPFNDSQTEAEMFGNTIITSRGIDSDASTSENITLGRLGEID